MKGWGRILLAGFPALFIFGCPGTVNPAAQLEGVWQLIFDEPGDLAGFDIRLTFDGNGELTLINAEGPQGGSASLNVQDSTTTVEDNQVTVTVPTAAGDRTFEGTLSDDGNTIDGAFSQSIELPSGDLDVTLPGSGATLERLDTDDECDSNDDCADGEVCTGGECVADEPECDSNDDCEVGEVCTDGECVADGGNGGDPAAGQTFYTNNNCAACHGADATGGIGPNIQDATAEEIFANLSGADPHPVTVQGVTMENAEDLEAYLASL